VSGGSPSPQAGTVRFTSGAGRWILAVTVLGSGLAFFEATVISIALPSIGDDLGVGLGGLQWVLNGYLLTLASLILLGGSLGDRFGRRLIFNIGIAWFTAASVLSAFAPNVGLLIAARLLQGVGGALMTPGSLAIIESTFHPDDRARAIGAWAGLSGVAAALGPLLGGFLIEEVSWRAIFLVNLPLGALVLAMSARHVPETSNPTVRGGLDYRGSILVTLGLGGLTYALIQAPEQGLGTPGVLAAALVGVAALLAFGLAEHRSRNPMMPLEIFRSRQFTSANLITFLVYAALGGVFFLLVVFLQVVLGYSPIAAGAASLPVTGLLLLLSPRAGALAERIGPRVPLTLGPAAMGVGMLLMSRIDGDDSYLSTVLPAVVVFGAGLALTVAPVTATVLAAADPRHSGVASAVNNAVARVAGLASVTLFPLVAGLSGAELLEAGPMQDGFRIAMIFGAALSFAGGVLAWVTISDDVLHTTPVGDQASSPERAATDYCCPIAGTQLRPAAEASGRPVAALQPSVEPPAAT
jgi:EmrB/QacA subfamily drug resistance transporter